MNFSGVSMNMNLPDCSSMPPKILSPFLMPVVFRVGCCPTGAHVLARDPHMANETSSANIMDAPFSFAVLRIDGHVFSFHSDLASSYYSWPTLSLMNFAFWNERPIFFSREHMYLGLKTTPNLENISSAIIAEFQTPQLNPFFPARQQSCRRVPFSA